MILSDIELHGSYRDLGGTSLAQMIERERPEEHGILAEHKVAQIVADALSDRSTKLQRFKALELALSHYDGCLTSPLDQLVPRLLTEDPALTIDVVLDVWMRCPIFASPLLAPQLPITHHPERLRQMLGVVASELHEDIDDYSMPGWRPSWDHDGNSFVTKRDRAVSRRNIASTAAALGATLTRFQEMQYRTEEIPDFAAVLILDLRKARAAEAITERQLAKLQGPFLKGLHQPGRPDLLLRAQRRLAPDAK
jgi:hypothetical protein